MTEALPDVPQAPPGPGSHRPILDVSGLKVSYGSLDILADVTLQIPRGAITFILGKSGCGKTTLLRALLGFIEAKEGHIGFLPRGQESPTSVEERRDRVGIVFQSGALIGGMTVRENVALPLIMHTALSPSVQDTLVSLALHRVSMSHALERFPAELSGGMKKRAAIARAIVMEPELLFCDEPGAGLDPLTSQGLDQLLRELKGQGITIVVVSHELDSIRAIADHVVMLDRGRVLYQGSLGGALQTGDGRIVDFFERRGENKGSLVEGASVLDELLGEPAP